MKTGIRKSGSEPHVVSVRPFENGAQDVDPSVPEIEFRFNEPTHGFSFGYGPLGGRGGRKTGGEKSGTEFQIQVLEDFSVRNKAGVSAEGYF